MDFVKTERNRRIVPCINGVCGNFWFTAGIPVFLEQCRIPLPSSVETLLKDTWTMQVKALCALQAESDLWHTVLDDATSYEEVIRLRRNCGRHPARNPQRAAGGVL